VRPAPGEAYADTGDSACGSSWAAVHQVRIARPLGGRILVHADGAPIAVTGGRT
jgi:hypothetical protein